MYELLAKIPFSCLSFELEKQRRPDKHRFKKCTSSPAARGVDSSLTSIFMYSGHFCGLEA